MGKYTSKKIQLQYYNSDLFFCFSIVQLVQMSYKYIYLGEYNLEDFNKNYITFKSTVKIQSKRLITAVFKMKYKISFHNLSMLLRLMSLFTFLEARLCASTFIDAS